MQKKVQFYRLASVTLALLMAFLLQASIACADSRTFSARGEYTMSDYDSPEVAEKRALEYAKRGAQEKAGVYIASYTKSVGAQISEDQVNFLAGTLLQVEHQDTRKEVMPGGDIHIIVEITVRADTSTIDSALRQNDASRQADAAMYAELQKRMEQQRKDNEALKSKIAALKAKGQPIEAMVRESKAKEREFMSDTKIDDSLRFHAEGNDAAVLAACDEAIRLNPRNFWAYNNRGATLAEKGQLDAAIAEFSKALAVNPDFAMGYNNRGKAHYDKKRYETALVDFTKAIEASHDNINIYAEAYCFRGKVNLMLGKYDAAVADCSEAISIAPYNAFAYMIRGVAYVQIRQDDKAIADIQYAVSIEPDNQFYRQLLEKVKSVAAGK